MNALQEQLIKQRRLFVLRLIIRAGGATNQKTLQTALPNAFLPEPSHADVKADLDHLVKIGCLDEEWLSQEVRAVKVTARGDDVAHTRLEVPGVAHESHIDWPS